MTTPGPYSGAYGAPPVPQAVTVDGWPEPMLYPQLLRTPTWTWWRPVLGTIALLTGVFLLASVLTLPILAAGVAIQSAIDHTAFGPAFSAALSTKRVTPASMLWLNVTIALGTPLAWLLVRTLHRVRPRWLTSVLPGMRWRFLLACLPLAVLALAVQVILSAFLPVGDASAPTTSVNHLGGQALAFALVVLLSTPFQALGEEYVFRGYLMQAIGSLFRRWSRTAEVVTLVATALLFALFHGVQNFPLFFDRFSFGLIAAYLTLKIGGLEPGIALHVVNNFVAYGFALLFGDITGIFQTTAVSAWQIPVTVAQAAVYVVCVLALARRLGLSNRTPCAPAAPPGPVGAPIGDGPR